MFYHGYKEFYISFLSISFFQKRVLKKKSEDYDDETLPHPIQKMSRVEQSISPINERRQSLQQVENVSVSEEMRENTEGEWTFYQS